MIDLNLKNQHTLELKGYKGTFTLKFIQTEFGVVVRGVNEKGEDIHVAGNGDTPSEALFDFYRILSSMGLSSDDPIQPIKDWHNLSQIEQERMHTLALYIYSQLDVDWLSYEEKFRLWQYRLYQATKEFYPYLCSHEYFHHISLGQRFFWDFQNPR